MTWLKRKLHVLFSQYTIELGANLKAAANTGSQGLAFKK